MNSKRALVFIFITILLDCMGLGIIIPTLPELIKSLSGSNTSMAASTAGWLQVAYALMAFVFAPIQGALSDRFGRRPVLLTALAGFGLDYLILFWAPNLTWLFVGRIIAGICGASFTTASAYIADVSSSENRAQNFGLIGAAFGLGFILGPVLGSVFAQWGLRAPFIAAAVCSLLNFTFGLFVLPESLSVQHRKKLTWQACSPFLVFRYLFSNTKLWPLMLIFFLLHMAGQVMPSTWTFFCIETVHWNAQWIGYSLGFVGVLISIVQGGLIGFFKRRVGARASVFIGLLGYLSGMLLYSFARESWMLFVFMLPYAMGGLAIPNLQSLMSGTMPENEQGMLQGGLTALMSLTTIVSPLLMTQSFTWATSNAQIIYFPGIAFSIGAVFIFTALLISVKYLKSYTVSAITESK